jgi:hypothetical protein
VSLGQIEEDGHKIIMHADFLKIWDHHGHAVAKVKRAVNRLYMIRLDIDRPVCLAAQGDSLAWRWHARFGHLNFHGLQRLAMGEMVKGLPQIDHVDQVCDSCLTSKQRRLSFPGEAQYRVTNKLELMHGDLCGSVMLVTPINKQYFFLLIDDVNHYMGLALLSTKDEATMVFKAFQAKVEAEVKKKLGTLRTNHRGEFTTCGFLEHCINNGIQCHFTTPHSPEQNGVVERRNQFIMGMARSMMKGMLVPGWLWGEAVTTVAFILNLLPT